MPSSDTCLTWALRVVAPALTSAALFSACFPPMEISALAWIAFVPLLGSIALGASTVESRALGLLFGLAVAGWNLSWLINVFDASGAAFWIVFATFPAIVTGTLAAIRDRWGAIAALAFAAPVWIGVEHFRSELWPLRFGWLGAGYALAASDVWIQAADLGGVYGLGLASIATSALVVSALLSRSPQSRTGLALSAIAIPLALGGYGVWHHASPRTEPTIPVAALQYETQELEGAESLASRIAHPVSLIVAPEIAAASHHGRPVRLDAPEPSRVLASLTRQLGAVLVIGGTREAPNDEFYNSLAIVEPDGTTTYITKAEPVPLVADGVRAERITAVPSSLGRLGAAICYDATHPHVIGALAPDAELLVFASGDLASWGELQHLQHARMVRVRAVEHRRWVVRATSSGITQIIDSRGEIREELGYGHTGVVIGSVARSTERTLRDILGGPLAWLTTWIAALAIGFVVADHARTSWRSRTLGSCP